MRIKIRSRGKGQEKKKSITNYQIFEFKWYFVA